MIWGRRGRRATVVILWGSQPACGQDKIPSTTRHHICTDDVRAERTGDARLGSGGLPLALPREDLHLTNPAQASLAHFMCAPFRPWRALWVSPMTTGDRSQEPVARGQESVQGSFSS